MKCDSCLKRIREEMPDVIYNDWLKLMFYFDHEFTEGEITAQTHNDMTERLMSVKPDGDYAVMKPED